MIAKVNVLGIAGGEKIKIASTLHNIAQCHMPFVPNTKQKKPSKFNRTKKPGCAECSVGYRQNGP